MTIRRSRLSASGSMRRRKKPRSDHQKFNDRKLLLERLEDRRLLAAGPRLAGIQPNNSDLFSFTEQGTNVRDVAPRELDAELLGGELAAAGVILP